MNTVSARLVPDLKFKWGDRTINLDDTISWNIVKCSTSRSGSHSTGQGQNLKVSSLWDLVEEV